MMKYRSPSCFLFSAVYFLVGITLFYSSRALAETHYFFVCPTSEAAKCGSLDDFVIALDDSNAVKTAEDIVAGKITDKVHVSGKIIKRQASYNLGWHFFLDPESIEFFTFAPTVCGRNITTSVLEKNLAKVGTPGFLPLGTWCPVILQVSKTARPGAAPR
jgi:hypothetical protein